MRRTVSRYVVDTPDGGERAERLTQLLSAGLERLARRSRGSKAALRTVDFVRDPSITTTTSIPPPAEDA